jgi:SAM-dependent methyltransferase
LSQQDLEDLYNQVELFQLMSQGIISLKPPFVLKPELEFVKECMFYQLADSLAIAEIGAGNGLFSQLVALSFDHIYLCINDVDEQSAYLESQMKTNPIEAKVSAESDIMQHNEIVLAYGNAENPNLGERKYDRVIIRNANHHFTHKKAMLAAIKLSLKPDAKIYLLEPNQVFLGKKECLEAMATKKIKRQFHKAGYQFVHESKLNKSRWMLEFKAK